LGSQGPINSTLRVRSDILIPCESGVHAHPPCSAPGPPGSDGLDKLPRPNHQPNLLRVPSVVLVACFYGHGQLPRFSEEPPGAIGCCASHGGLCTDPGGSLRVLFTSSVNGYERKPRMARFV
jgi:hypothetical protein